MPSVKRYWILKGFVGGHQTALYVREFASIYFLYFNYDDLGQNGIVKKMKENIQDNKSAKSKNKDKTHTWNNTATKEATGSRYKN